MSLRAISMECKYSFTTTRYSKTADIALKLRGSSQKPLGALDSPQGFMKPPQGLCKASVKPLVAFQIPARAIQMHPGAI